MKATAVFDVLSHWCLSAWPAYEALTGKLGASNVTLLLAPVLNGFPMGVTPEAEAWFYTRGTRAYGAILRSDWYESDTTTTLWANATVAAAACLGADLATVVHGTMEAAMKDGAMLGRREVAVRAVARVAGIDAKRLDAKIDRAETGAMLNEGNAALARWGCAERPSWRIENANGDFIVTQGVWQAAPLMACADALMADEAAYAAAGTPPG
jgi:2-hydroxychromene-2-carboxylate isomerase